jgi:hypothetical protein
VNGETTSPRITPAETQDVSIFRVYTWRKFVLLRNEESSGMWPLESEMTLHLIKPVKVLVLPVSITHVIKLNPLMPNRSPGHLDPKVHKRSDSSAQQQELQPGYPVLQVVLRRHEVEEFRHIVRHLWG